MIQRTILIVSDLFVSMKLFSLSAAGGFYFFQAIHMDFSPCDQLTHSCKDRDMSVSRVLVIQADVQDHGNTCPCAFPFSNILFSVFTYMGLALDLLINLSLVLMYHLQGKRIKIKITNKIEATKRCSCAWDFWIR